MKYALGLVLTLTLAFAVGLDGTAQEKDKKGGDKAVTLKGTITCSKCDLGETTACGNVIQVKEGDKTVVYYFADNGAKEPYHAKICKSPLKGSVTGVVSEKDKKKTITPAKDGVKFD